MIYKHIDFLPVYNYFKCSEGHLEFLYANRKEHVSKSISDYFFVLFNRKKLNKIWEQIEVQFEERMKDDSVNETREQIYDSQSEKLRLKMLMNCFVMLAVKHDEELAEIVKRNRLRYDKNNRLESLQAMKGELNNLYRKQKRKEQELKDNKKESDDIDMFDTISKIESYKQIPLNIYTLTVSQFIAYIKEVKTIKPQENE